MLRVRFLLALLLLLGACGTRPPSTNQWSEQSWNVITAVVPEPADATADACQSALGQLRELAVDLEPAPSPEVHDAASGWLTAAESLMFRCSSDRNDDYAEGYEQLLLRQAEVDVVLEGS